MMPMGKGMAGRRHQGCWFAREIGLMSGFGESTGVCMNDYTDYDIIMRRST